MGAGASTAQLAATYDKQAAKKLIGKERWQDKAWNKVAKKQNGTVSAVQLGQICAKADCVFGGYAEISLLMCKDIPYTPTQCVPRRPTAPWNGAQSGASRSVSHRLPAGTCPRSRCGKKAPSSARSASAAKRISPRAT